MFDEGGESAATRPCRPAEAARQFFPVTKCFLSRLRGNSCTDLVPCANPGLRYSPHQMRFQSHPGYVIASMRQTNENIVGIRSARDKCGANRLARIEKDQSTCGSSLTLGSPLRHCSTFAFREREEEKEVGI